MQGVRVYHVRMPWYRMAYHRSCFYQHTQLLEDQLHTYREAYRALLTSSTPSSTSNGPPHMSCPPCMCTNPAAPQAHPPDATLPASIPPSQDPVVLAAGSPNMTSCGAAPVATHMITTTSPSHPQQQHRMHDTTCPTGMMMPYNPHPVVPSNHDPSSSSSPQHDVHHTPPDMPPPPPCMPATTKQPDVIPATVVDMFFNSDDETEQPSRAVGLVWQVWGACAGSVETLLYLWVMHTLSYTMPGTCQHTQCHTNVNNTHRASCHPPPPMPPHTSTPLRHLWHIPTHLPKMISPPWACGPPQQHITG